MRPAIVSDDYTIINTQGIRFVEKVDQSYGDRSTTTYQLRVTYKGDKMDFRYKDAALRDEQFARLCAAMDSATKPDTVNR
jgi:hypothetical protein